jgi:hypothetical protein
MARTCGTGGRILPHERDVDNLVPILGATFTDLGANYNDLYNETLQQDMNDRTQKYYWRRNIRVATFWEEHCPEYFLVSTRDVSAQDLQDVGKFFYGRYEEDLVYQGLNVKYLIIFFMSTKKKENGKFLSFTDVRKYKDTILWGARIAKEWLPTTFYEEIENTPERGVQERINQGTERRQHR